MYDLSSTIAPLFLFQIGGFPLYIGLLKSEGQSSPNEKDFG